MQLFPFLIMSTEVSWKCVTESEGNKGLKFSVDAILFIVNVFIVVKHT